MEGVADSWAVAAAPDFGVREDDADMALGVWFGLLGDWMC